jgi:hypothetical protein
MNGPIYLDQIHVEASQASSMAGSAGGFIPALCAEWLRQRLFNFAYGRLHTCEFPSQLSRPCASLVNGLHVGPRNA